MVDSGYGYWPFVVINIALFSLFVFLLPYRRNENSALATYSRGALIAFIAALFTEMYGFPLTIYILSWAIGYQNPLTHESGHLLYPELGMFSPLHFLSIAMIGAGIILVIEGWSKIYKVAGALVTDGMYSYVRHPQYLGILLLTSGFLLQWITMPTAVMFPILVWLYYRLARKEEQRMESTFGTAYSNYKSKVPMFFPRLHPSPTREHGVDIVRDAAELGE